VVEEHLSEFSEEEDDDDDEDGQDVGENQSLL
jgi:hypothetical protein